MKRPGWATAAGVLGIVFACFGIFGAASEFMMPSVMEIQKEILGEMRKAAEYQPPGRQEEEGEGAETPRPPMPFPQFGFLEKLFDLPGWFGAWSAASGSMRLAVNGLYILASVFLLQTKRRGVTLFYWAAGTSIAYSVVKGAVAAVALPFFGVAMMAGGLFGIVIDVVLLVVVATGDKTAFRAATRTALS